MCLKIKTRSKNKIYFKHSSLLASIIPKHLERL